MSPLLRQRLRVNAFALDLCGERPYLDGTMMRQLLTLFALLTGLAAAAAPAQAHFAGAETRMEAAFEIVVTADRRQQDASLAPAPALARAVSVAASTPRFDILTAPGVLVGIDRARE